MLLISLVELSKGGEMRLEANDRKERPACAGSKKIVGQGGENKRRCSGRGKVSSKLESDGRKEDQGGISNEVKMDRLAKSSLRGNA